jgi:hypothetical protein
MGLMDDYVNRDVDIEAERKRIVEETGGKLLPRDRPSTQGTPKTRTAVESEERRQNAQRTEEEVVDQLRANLSRAVDIEAGLLERAADTSQRDLPAALRAVSDVKSKSLDGLLKLTGRAADPEAVSLHELVVSMVRRGFVKANVSLDIGPSTDIEGDSP